MTMLAQIINMIRNGKIGNSLQIDKNRRLAEIARERNALKDEIAKAMRQKKSTSPMYHALRALKVEELKLEGRR
jgi:uncharacterized protein YwgA